MEYRDWRKSNYQPRFRQVHAGYKEQWDSTKIGPDTIHANNHPRQQQHAKGKCHAA